jgi:hypothetical protein
MSEHPTQFRLFRYAVLMDQEAYKGKAWFIYETFIRYTITDRRLMKRVDNFHTDDLDEALALCKLMNEGEKI